MEHVSSPGPTRPVPDHAHRVGVVGLGLIGGSFVKAYHREGWPVYAWNRTPRTLEKALGETVDGVLDNDTIPACDLIVLTTYPEHCVQWLRDQAGSIDPRTVVIDTAGTKRSVCDACWAIARDHGFSFVGAHPMAGTQYSGYDHAQATLFTGAPMVLCADPTLSETEAAELLERTEALLAPCRFGSFTLTDPVHHDQVIAYTSQLAHVVSNAYAKSPRALSQKGFSAGSWRDLTRVAELNPTMWTELFLDDRDFLADEVDLMIENLTAIRDALRADDGEKLNRLLSEGVAMKKEADGR